jgi:tripartite-type tricarboxylate transporter receptor subunit TctC
MRYARRLAKKKIHWLLVKVHKQAGDNSMKRRSLIKWISAGASSAYLWNNSAQAQASASKFPEKPIKIIVPFPPGGPADALARPLAQQLGDRLKQVVVIENRPGANTVIGAQHLLNSPADGYTMMLANEAGLSLAPAIAPIMGNSPPYKSETDFAAISMLTQYGSVLSMSPSLPVQTLPEFLAYAKQNPGKLSYASVGVGSQPQMMMEILNLAEKLDIVHIPYQGVAPAVIDLLAGRVQVMISAPAAPGPHIRNGKLKGLAYSGTQRLHSLPMVPTFAEGGLPNYEARGWFGIIMHGNTPEPIKSMLAEAIWSIAKSPSYQANAIMANGLEPATVEPANFQAFLAKDVRDWKARIESIKNRIK